MTERKSKRKVVILRYFLTEIICCDVHVCWLYRVRQLNTLLKNRRKVFLCWGFVRNVYLLDRWLVKGPGKPWDRGSWGKKKVPTIRSQAAGKLSETVGFHAWRGRLRFATWVIRSSGSASLKQPFQARRERMITTWKLDLEAWRTSKVRQTQNGPFWVRSEPAELIEGPWTATAACGRYGMTSGKFGEGTEREEDALFCWKICFSSPRITSLVKL